MQLDLGDDLCKSLETSDKVTIWRESIVGPVWIGLERVDSKLAGVRRSVPKAASLSLSILPTKYSANNLDKSQFSVSVLDLSVSREWSSTFTTL